MPNSAIHIPFYVAKDGRPLAGAAAQMTFAHLRTVAGVDKSAHAPAITEIGAGWYAFAVAWGTPPFDAGDLVGVIDADTGGLHALANAERYIPVEVRLDFYALARLVNRMSQSKLNGDMFIQNEIGDPILKLSFSDGDGVLERIPGAAD